MRICNNEANIVDDSENSDLKENSIAALDYPRAGQERSLLWLRQQKILQSEKD
jgi:hypothetical protein